ncbi:MAG TPA: hypothetical protein VJT31_17565 [Rugosimonospora sp.]|nr:hypothetical protein [Rugosimonospora sp.]
MREVRLACEPAPGRDVNEDAAFVVGELVGVLDGVTRADGMDDGCSHGPAWYVQRLAGHLGAAYTAAPAADLPTLLATAIDAVRGDHAGTCDLSRPSTPAAAVCLLRACAAHADYLILCDTPLVLDQGDHVEVVTDDRFTSTIHRIRQAVGASPVRQSTVEKYEYINQPDGYWIAAAEPRAAFEAVTGRAPLDGPRRVRRAALLTDGASCAVDQFGLFDWPTLLDLVADRGPAELIRRVRHAETCGATGPTSFRYKRHDDASVALCLF